MSTFSQQSDQCKGIEKSQIRENQGLELSQMAWANMARSGKKSQVSDIQESYLLGGTQNKVCVENGKFLPDMFSLW